MSLSLVLLGLLVFTLFTAPIAWVLPPEPPAPPQGEGAAPAGFRPLRRPVLGHGLELDVARDRYRAVVHPDAPGAAPVVLREGTLEECTAALLASLDERWGKGRPNVPLPSLGGLQLWGDVRWHAGWRVQEHALTGHFRLLDARDVRRAWGTREACVVALERAKAEHELRLASPHLVVLLHGLGRTRGSLDRLKDALRAAGYETADVGYPSLRRSIDEHAAQVEGLFDALDTGPEGGVERVSFVTHSLGGLVTRRLLARGGAWRERIAVHRLAMIAPPSRGSSFAAALAEYLPFEALVGPSGRGVLAAEAAAIPPPDCRFAILAGARGDGAGWNPLVAGDDDGVVALEETKLDGAEATRTFRGLHSFLMNDPEVVAAVVRYLGSGRLID